MKFTPIHITESPTLPTSLFRTAKMLNRRALLEAQGAILMKRELEELREQNKSLPGVADASSDRSSRIENIWNPDIRGRKGGQNKEECFKQVKLAESISSEAAGVGGAR